MARERQDFALRPSLTLVGALQSASTQASPAGQLVFSPRGAGAIALTPRQARVQRGQYHVDLLQGSYDVTFFPEGRSAPMKIWRDQTFTLSTNFSRTLPVPLAISGTVSHQLPGALDARPLPVAGARVVARSQRTGELSTTALTSAEGIFALQVRPESGPFDVIVSPDDAQDLLPRVVFLGRIDTQEGQQPAPLALSLGQLSRVARPVTLRMDPEQREALDFHPEDLRIIARAPSFGAGELEVTTRWRAIETPGRSPSDPPTDWSVTLNLPALAHTVELLPPPTSRFARARFTLDLTSALSEQIVRLDPKAELALRVVDQMGAPLARASVTLTPERQYTALTQEGVEQEALTLETDDEGRLTAWVEPTRYQAEVSPHSASSQPRAVFTLEGAMADAANPRELRLPAAQLIEGAVYDDALQPMPALRLQVHETVDAQLRLIGEASTDGAGEFRVVIPAR